MTKLQAQRKRQGEIPEAFAMATLAAAIREPKTKAQKRQAAADARKVARLIRRGEL